MNEFTHTNIYATKGIEYLIVIAFLLAIIPFWRFINAPLPAMDRVTAPARSAWEQLRETMQAGFYIDPSHAWAFLQQDGKVLVGPDNFLLANTGPVKYINLMHPGDIIKRGQAMGSIEQESKVLNLYAPISGKIAAVNKHVSSLEMAKPHVDTYPWMYTVQPDNWGFETKHMLVAAEAERWIHDEYDQLKDFLSFSLKKYGLSDLNITLAAGGEIVDRVLMTLPDEIWQEFQIEFIESRKENL